MRNGSKGYLEWAQRHALVRYADPILINMYSEVLQRFRLAGRGGREGCRPPARLRQRIDTFCDPLPFYYDTPEAQNTEKHRCPLNAVTQRPVAMYHSWDSQNA